MKTAKVQFFWGSEGRSHRQFLLSKRLNNTLLTSLNFHISLVLLSDEQLAISNEQGAMGNER